MKLAHDRGKLTQEQKRSWEQDGYLIVPSALSSEEVSYFEEAVDNLHERYLNGAVPNLSRDKETALIYPPHWEWIDEKWERAKLSFRRWRIIEDDPKFGSLLDHRNWFDIVLDLVGAEILVTLTHLIVLPPGAKDEPYLHVDGGDALGRIRPSEDSPAIAIKVMIFLNDLSNPDCGNFSVLPGSHHRPFDARIAKDIVLQDRAKQILARPGDAVIFPHSLWHGPAHNKAVDARKTLMVGYAPLCFRPYDYESAVELRVDGFTPRQKRLLGDLGGWYWRAGCYYYSGPDQTEVMSIAKDNL